MRGLANVQTKCQHVNGFIHHSASHYTRLLNRDLLATGSYRQITLCYISIQVCKSKGNVATGSNKLPRHKNVWRGVDVPLHVFLTSALNRFKWRASRPGRFTAGEIAPFTRSVKKFIPMRCIFMICQMRYTLLCTLFVGLYICLLQTLFHS